MPIERLHGLRMTDEYTIWATIKDKCLNPKSRAYHRFGGRGITMHGPWAEDFRSFIKSIGHRPAPGYRLARSDKDGNFEPGNLSWSKGLYVEAAPSKKSVDPKILALVGQKFNKLTVVGVARYTRGKTKKSCYKLVVQCSCESTQFTIFVHALGKTQSCGCSTNYESRIGERNYKFRGYREIRGRYWAQVQHGAQTRGLEFSISLECIWDIFEQQNRRCALSGVLISFGPGPQTASLDRIDPSLGYISGNVQWVHKKINIIKMDLSVSDFVEWCRLVSTNHPLP